MNKDRLAAFSDGVLAIIITIMALELKVPSSPDWSGLVELWPVFLSYALSFAYIAIYWNNHHHLLHTVTRVNGAILWANNNLLFWLSLVPFTTTWAGETHFAKQPTIVYGVALLMPALAFSVLVRTIIKAQPDDSELARAVGADVKGNISLALYVAGIALGFFAPALSYVCFGAVALIWIVPDTRIEKRVGEAGQAPASGA